MLRKNIKLQFINILALPLCYSLITKSDKTVKLKVDMLPDQPKRLLNSKNEASYWTNNWANDWAKDWVNDWEIDAVNYAENDTQWEKFVKDFFDATNKLRTNPSEIKKYFEDMKTRMGSGKCQYYPGQTTMCLQSREGVSGQNETYQSWKSLRVFRH